MASYPFDHPRRTGLRKLISRQPGQGVFLTDAEIREVIAEYIEGTSDQISHADVFAALDRVAVLCKPIPRRPR